MTLAILLKEDTSYITYQVTLDDLGYPIKRRYKLYYIQVTLDDLGYPIKRRYKLYYILGNLR